MIIRLILLLTPILAAILVIFLKEYSKAITCTILGDSTLKETGRLSINPFKHIEPIGLILLLNFGTLGWGKPVETRKYRYKKPREAVIIASVVPLIVLLFLGAFSNFLMTAPLPFDLSIYLVIFLQEFLFSVMIFSFGLFIFNLIVPLFPFEASGILKSFISPNQAMNFSMNEKTYLFMLVLVFFMLGNRVNDFFGNMVYGMIVFFRSL